jgi:putative ABC transport system permease protein
LGLLLCFWGCNAIVALVNDPEVLASGSLRPDASVWLFALVLSVAVGVAVGTPPAWSASRPNVEAALKGGGRMGVTRSRRRLTRSLVTAEVALAVVLLTCAGLLLRSLHHVLAVDPGMDTRNVLSLRLLSAGKPPAQPKLLYRRIAEEIDALPGVQAVATAFPLPLSHDYSGYIFHVEGQPIPADGRYPHSRNHYVTPEYFRVMGLRFLRGQPFDETSEREGERAVVINETMVRTCWPGEDAIGKRIAGGRADRPEPWWTVVGVVRDTAEYGLREAQAEIYYPTYGLTGLLVRAEGDPLQLIQAIRTRLAAVDRTLAVYDVATLDRQLAAASLPWQVMGLLATVFAALALVLAAVGIYGVVAHAMAQRRQEIGIRMTLGAEATDVLRLVLREGMLPVLVGVALGIVGAYGAAGALASQLYGVQVTDLAIHAATPLLLTAVAFLACWLPARRAAKIDPMVALRYE